MKTPNRTTRKWEAKDSKIHLFSDINYSEILRDLILDRELELNGEGITLLDLFNMNKLDENNEDDVTKGTKFILDKIGIDISTPEGIEKINQLLQEAITFYNEYLYRNVPNSIKGKHLKTTKDVITFLNGAAKSGNLRQTYCNILKIGFVIHDILNSPELQDLDNKSKKLVKEKFTHKLQMTDSDFPDHSNIGLGYYTKDTGRELKSMKFYIRFRGKEEGSIALKAFTNAEVDKDSLVNDGIAIEIILQTKEEILFFLEYIYLHVLEEIFCEKYKEFRQSGLFSKEEITNFIKKYNRCLDPDFVDALKHDVGAKIKAKSNQKFQAIKFIAAIPIANSDEELAMKQQHIVEIRCILEDNRNESGMADHRIFDGLKRIHTMIRLQGYVTEIYIKRVIAEIKKESPDLPHNENNIFNYYMESLLKLQNRGGKNSIYTVPGRWNALAGTSLYPTNVTGAKKPDGGIQNIPTPNIPESVIALRRTS